MAELLFIYIVFFFSWDESTLQLFVPLTKSKIQMESLTLCRLSTGNVVKNMLDNPQPTHLTTTHPLAPTRPLLFHHLIQVLPHFKIMLLSRVQLSLSGCLWFFFFFFSICGDKSKITQDCPHTIGAATNALILFLTFSTHLIRSISRMRTYEVHAGDGLRFRRRSPFFLSVSKPLSLFVSRPDHPHTHCQREIAMSVCPVQCVMCDNLWRTYHVPAVLGFHEKLLIIVIIFRHHHYQLEQTRRVPLRHCSLQNP